MAGSVTGVSGGAAAVAVWGATMRKSDDNAAIMGRQNPQPPPGSTGARIERHLHHPPRLEAGIGISSLQDPYSSFDQRAE